MKYVLSLAIWLYPGFTTVGDIHVRGHQFATAEIAPAPNLPAGQGWDAFDGIGYLPIRSEPPGSAILEFDPSCTPSRSLERLD